MTDTGCWKDPDDVLSKGAGFSGSTAMVLGKICRFLVIKTSASGLLSTKVTCLAPRLSASSPSAPVPAKRSSTTASWIRCPIILNRASLALSEVGRMACPWGLFSLSPLAYPLMILNDGLQLRRMEVIAGQIYFVISCSAICTAFKAAPFRILSDTTQRLIPLSIDSSSRIRPTRVSNSPAQSVASG